MGIKHVFVSGKSDSADTSLVRPSNWNDDHTIDGNVDPDTDNAYSLGSSGTAWSDLYLADGGFVDWGNSDARITHVPSTGSLILYADIGNAAASSQIFFSIDNSIRLNYNGGALYPNVNDDVSLGAASFGFSDLFLAAGGVINWNNGAATITEASSVITFATDGTDSRPFVFDYDGNASAWSSYSIQFDDAGTGGVGLEFVRDSASPAINDNLGYLIWKGQNDAAQEVEYASIASNIDDETDTTEEGMLDLNVLGAGSSNAAVFKLRGANTTVEGFYSSAQTQVPDEAWSGILFYSGASDGSGGPQFTIKNTTATPADNDVCAALYFRENDSGGNDQNYGGLAGFSRDVTSATEDGELTFIYEVGGTSRNPAWHLGYNGMFAVGATGGGKGEYTINATAVYDDNTLLTCYVDEAVQTGNVDLEKWAHLNNNDDEYEIMGTRSGRIFRDDGKAIEHIGAQRFKARLGTEYDPRFLACQKKHLADKKHLTCYPNPDKYNEENRPSVGGWVQRGVEMDELLFQYIVELESRIAALEN